MNLFKSRAAAVVVLILAVAGSTVYGSHRSLLKEAEKVTDQNGTVVQELKKRADLGDEFYALSSRLLSEQEPSVEKLQKAMEVLEQDVSDQDGQRDLHYALDGVSSLILDLDDLTEEDRDRLTELDAQLEAVEDALGSDPYNGLAEEFNNEVLGAFPARFLGKLTGVKALPVYH